LAVADSVGSIVLATWLAALVTAECQVMQPTVPRRLTNIIAVTMAFGNGSFWVMLDAPSFGSVTLGIVPCRAFTS